MYELEKLYKPGNVIDSSLLAQLLVGTLPTFVESRIQDFEQGQRQIYRKLNLLPAIAANVMRALAWGAALALGITLLDRVGWLSRFWALVPRKNIEPALELVAGHLALVGITVLFAAWAARALKARTMVKVQKEA